MWEANCRNIGIGNEDQCQRGPQRTKLNDLYWCIEEIDNQNCQVGSEKSAAISLPELLIKSEWLHLDGDSYLG